MADTLNRFSGPGSVGIYNDIVDEIYDINCAETPFMDTAKGVAALVAKDFTHSWISRVYANATTNGYKVYDGKALTSFTPPTDTAYSNYVEQTCVPWSIGKGMEAIIKQGGKAGVTNALTDQVTSARATLKINNEASLVNGTPVANAATTEGAMGGIVYMAQTYGSSDTTLASISAGETKFRTLLNTGANAGALQGNKQCLLCSHTNRDKIAQYWKGIADDVNTMAKDKTIEGSVDFYAHQYGILTIQGHRALASDDHSLVVYDTNDLGVAWLAPTQTIDYPLATVTAASGAEYNALTLQYDKPTTLIYAYVS